MKTKVKYEYIIILTIVIIMMLFFPSKKVQANQDITNQFKDENLKNAILEIVKTVTNDNSKTTITLEDIDLITSDDLPSGKQLHLANKNITDLSGLELFKDKGIEWIYLDWNNISDISALKEFNTLTKISASNNKISSLEPISFLINLQNINFSNNQISNINELKKLTNLKYCYLDNNTLSEIETVKYFSNLIELSISGNTIEDISIVSKLKNIVQIDASRNNILDIQNMSINSSIEKLNLDNNKLTNLKGIDKIANLKILSASNNKINDINEIKNLNNLYNLNLNKNAIFDITVLKNCANLEFLYLNMNNIINITPIEDLNNIKKLTIYNQTYSATLDKNYQSEEFELLLTSLFKNLKNPQSKIYSSNVKCNNVNNIEYKITDDFGNLIIKSEDVKKESLIFRFEDENYTYITLEICDIWEPKINVEYSNKNQTNTFVEVKIKSNEELQGITGWTLSEDKLSLSKKYIENMTEIVMVRDLAGNESTVYVEVSNIKNSEEFKVNMLDDKYILAGIDGENNTVNRFLQMADFDEIYQVKLYKDNKEIKGNDKITTDTILRLYNEENNIYQDYEIIFYGDTNGDGQLSAIDALLVIKNKIGENQFNNNIYLEAGRVTEKTREQQLIPNSADALAIVSAKLGKYNIKQ